MVSFKNDMKKIRGEMLVAMAEGLAKDGSDSELRRALEQLAPVFMGVLKESLGDAEDPMLKGAAMMMEGAIATALKDD